MLDIIDFDQLKNLVKSASRETFINLQHRYRDEGLNGFALCTDDSVMTIYHMASTEKWSDNHAEFRYSPVEWRLTDNDRLFDPAYELIMARVERQYDEQYEDKFEQLVDLTFNSFVTALYELKQEGVIPDTVFLTVMSTDPGDHMLELESAANKLLNNSEQFANWKAWNEKYN